MDYFDLLETQDPKDRERHLQEALPEQISHARQYSAAFARLLDGVEPEEITDRRALAALPVLRRPDLLSWQNLEPPFGGLAAKALGDLARVFRAPISAHIPEARRSDYWRFARALFAAGFRQGQLIYNAASYHLNPAGFMVDSGAWALGCPVLPAGAEQPEQQLAAIAQFKPKGYAGAPSFLKRLLDSAAESGADISSITKALVFGEPLSEELRAEFEERGIEAFQCYATADLGLIAYETPALEGMVVDEGVLVEILRPGAVEPVAEGEEGEVVVTTFNPDYPLIRFATGDLSAVVPGPSPCGRTNTRLEGLPRAG